MPTPSYDDIKKQIERRYRRLTWFVLHIVVTVTLFGLMWAVVPSFGVATIMFSALWLGGLIFHGFKVWLDNARDLDIERAWTQMSTPETDADEKPKRHLRLSDDAELEVIEDEASPLRQVR